MSTRWGGFLEQIDGFDPLFFGISPREALQMDPQQRLALELSWEALEDTGLVPSALKGGRVGVFIGAMWSDYAKLTYGTPQAIDQYSATGQDTSIIAGRVSYSLGLQGPSLVVNTACSSSLVAVHLACQSLRLGESTVALAGGVHVISSPLSMVAMSKFGAMSPHGRCRAFDSRADGYVRGEGGGLIVLKPLGRAVLDGDRVYAVIRGSAINNDGFSNGLTAPNPKAQEQVLRQAYVRAGVAPGRVHFVETHGPGTALGDPIEAQALGAVLGAGRPADRPLRIGSVKTNLGHLEAAAGIAGLMKTALALEHRALPRNLHFEQPNPRIPFEALRLQVQRELTPWPDLEEPATAGINSFGFGGTNCHVVLQGMPERQARLLPVSAENLTDLQAQVLGLLPGAARLKSQEELDAFCHGAVRSLSPGRLRAAFVARTPSELFDRLTACIRQGVESLARGAAASGSRPRLAFVCSGQGSQWLGMGRALLRTEPAFRAALMECDALIQRIAGWSVMEQLVASRTRSRLQEVDVTQPLLFSLQVALGALWRSWGVEPDVVIGHSMGEVAAACLAGVLSLEDAALVICTRSRLARQLAGAGAMAVVRLPAQQVAEAMAGHSSTLAIAAYNAPRSLVLSGDPAALDDVLGRLAEQGTDFARVNVDFASHSPQMEALREPLLGALARLQPRRARVRLLSTVSLTDLEGPECGADYWFRNLREPVHFAQAVDKLLGEGETLFLELSPHPILARSIEEGLAHQEARGAVLPSLRREEDEHSVLFESLGALWTHGVDVRWQSFHSIAGSPAVLLPVSAKSPEALRALAGEYQQYLREQGAELARDVAYTASVRRGHHAHRVAVVGSTREELAQGLGALLRGEVEAGACGEVAPKVTFVFSGQGSQWVGMGRELLQQQSVFREALEECERALKPYTGWSLREQLEAQEAAARLEEVDVVQPLLFALQVSLARLWRAWGVEPAAVVGHSMGEVAAAHVAGVLSLEEAARVIALRSQMVRRHASGKGAMAVVELPEEEAEQAIGEWKGRLVVGVINSPRSCVLSGERQALEQALERLSQAGVFCRRVKVDYASHSPQMEELEPELRAALAGLKPKPSVVPFYSTVEGRWMEGERMGGEYWVANLREPVRFAQAVRGLRESGQEVFLELSPHPVLVPVVEQGLRHLGKGGRALGTGRRQEEIRSLLETVGELYRAGQPMEFARLFPEGGRVVALPSYPWQRERYWLEVEVRREEEGGAQARAAREARRSLEARLLRREWKKMGARSTAGAGEKAGGKWLVLADGQGLGEQVKGLLEQRGQVVVCVGRPGSKGQGGAEGRVLQAATVQAFESLLKEAFSAEGCRGVVYLWSLDSGEPAEQGRVEQSVSVLHLVQALVRMGWRDMPRLWLVTRGAQAAEQQARSELSGVFQAPLWGLGQVLAYEHPELRCTRVDLSAAAHAGQGQALVEELLSTDREEQVALRPQGRYVARLVRGFPVVARGTHRGGERQGLQGTYLLCGALGGTGLEVARWLVGQGAQHLVLAGLGHEVGLTQARLEASGAQVEWVPVDVTDRKALGEALEQMEGRLPPLRGFVYMAQEPEPEPLAQQGQQRLLQQLEPLVRGAWNLHVLAEGKALDSFVLCSSLASLVGAPGQGCAAAGGAFLDALACYRHAQGLPGLSINWGPLEEQAPAAELQRGLEPVSAELGEAALRELLAWGGVAQAGVAALDGRQWGEFYTQAGASTYLSQLVRQPRLVERAAGRSSQVRQLLQQAEPSRKREVLERFIREQVAHVLRLAPERIDSQMPLRDLGVDSLMALDLRNRLESGLGLMLPATLVFTYPHVAALVESLSRSLQLPLSGEEERTPPHALRSSTGSQQEVAAEELARLPLKGEEGLQATSLDRPLVALKRLEARLQEFESAQAEPIAIIGLGCRMPGGVADPESFWRLLKEGVDAIREFPEHRWPARSIPGITELERQRMRWAGTLESVDSFDAGFFGISPREAVHLDPQHRLVLEVAWEALEDAGIPAEKVLGSRTGVFLGIISADYREQAVVQDPRGLEAYTLTGSMVSTAAGRLSYLLGLQGPCMSVDTACSSSMVAVHLACQSLRQRESELVLAGGVNLLLSPYSTLMLARSQALSPDGRCRAFDARANGYVRSEGCGFVVLKRLSDARRDGDRIWALIRGSAINQDGRSTGMTAPNALAQQQLIRQALVNARASPAQISYVEAHGTGTALGDPIELEALSAALGGQRAEQSVCALGSVKTNIGHLEAAAGVAGLQKVVLALHHELLPRHLHFEALNPRISLEGGAFAIPLESRPWRRTAKPRLAGVSSFGLSGTNVHVIVEEAPLAEEGPGGRVEEGQAVLLPLSARSQEALQALAGAYQGYLGGPETAPLRDVAYTAGVRRSHHAYRAAVVGRSRQELAERLGAFARGEQAVTAVGKAAPRVAFVFSGQGSQWAGMGRELLESQPVFRAAVARCEELLRQQVGWSLMEELKVEPGRSRLGETEVAQPALFALQVGLSELLESWGIEPAAVVGHSVGEVAAAYVSGGLSLEEAVRVVAQRSRLMQRATGQGRMAVVGLSLEQVLQLEEVKEGRLSVAAHNGPSSVVLSGERAVLERVLQELKARGTPCKDLRVNYAFHSWQMDPYLDELEASLEGLKAVRVRVPLYSTVVGGLVEGPELGGGYWARNVRQTVQFARAVQRMVQQGLRHFLEVGPHGVLCGDVQEVLSQLGVEGNASGTLRRGQPEDEALLGAVGALYRAGLRLDFSKLYPHGGRVVSLPLYPWQRRRYWREQPALAGTELRYVPKKGGHGHPLLGERLNLAGEGAAIWQGLVDLEALPFLREQQGSGRVVFPSTGYIEMALAAAREALGGAHHAVEDLRFERLLILSEEAPRLVQLRMSETTHGGAHRIQLFSWQRGSAQEPGCWVLHMQCTVSAGRPSLPPEGPSGPLLEDLRRRCAELLEGSIFYARAQALGNEWGPAFQGIERLWQGQGELLAEVKVRPELLPQMDSFSFHPAILEACCQGVAAAAGDQREFGACSGVSISRVLIYRAPVQHMWCHIRRVGWDSQRTLRSDILIMDDQGETLAEVVGVVIHFINHEGESGSIRSERESLGAGDELGEFLTGGRDFITQARAQAAGSQAAAQAPGSAEHLLRREQLLAAGQQERVRLLTEYLLRVVERILRLQEGEAVLSEGLEQRGMDSLMALELRSRLKAELQLDLPVIQVLAGSSLGDLAHYLLEQLPQPGSLLSA